MSAIVRFGCLEAKEIEYLRARGAKHPECYLDGFRMAETVIKVPEGLKLFPGVARLLFCGIEKSVRMICSECSIVSDGSAVYMPWDGAREAFQEARSGVLI